MTNELSFGRGHDGAIARGPSQMEKWNTAIRAGELVQAKGLRTGADMLTQDDKNVMATAIEAKHELADHQSTKNAFGPDGYGFAPGGNQESGKRFLDWSGKGRAAFGQSLVKEFVRGKSLLTGGTAGVVPVLPENLIGLGQVIPNLLSVIPAISVPGSGQVSYVRQQTRTNNAAPVAVGAVKPTSIYENIKITADLVVLAHLSEPTDRFILEDNASLSTFLGNELGYGIKMALEDQLLNGTGTAPAMRGILQVSGIQTQAAVGTDLLATLRRGITKLESAGYSGDLVIALSPTDWERVELARTSTSGVLELGGPVSRATQAVWGCPVAVTTALAAGTAVIFSQSALGYYYDSQQIRVDFSTPGDTWTRNQLVARAESRYVGAVFQSLGIVKITLPVAT